MAKRSCKVNYYRWSEGLGKPKRISREAAISLAGLDAVKRLRRMACSTGHSHGGPGGSRWSLVVRKAGHEEWLK
jgi:hypothetical protein